MPSTEQLRTLGAMASLQQSVVGSLQRNHYRKTSPATAGLRKRWITAWRIARMIYPQFGGSDAPLDEYPLIAAAISLLEVRRWGPQCSGRYLMQQFSKRNDLPA